MSDGSELALLQARLSSLERDLAAAGRRYEAKEEELRTERVAHAKRVRELEQREAVLEGKLSIADHELAKLQAAAAASSSHGPPHTPTSTTNAASSANQGGRRVPPIPGALATEGGKPAVSVALPTSPTPVQPTLPTLPLRPLLPYSEDSPFFRREEAVFAQKVTHLSTRLKKIVVKAKEFSLATQKQAETAAALSAELGGSWSDVEGGLDAIIAAAVHTQASQGGSHGTMSPSSSSSPSASSSSGHHRTSSTASAAAVSSARTRSSIIQSEELVSLSSAFGKLGAMLSTVSDIGSNLSVSVDAFLVSALVDFRTKHIQTLLDQEAALKKSMEEYEAAFVRRLNKKREKSMFASVTGVMTDKARKKAAMEEEEIRSLVLTCSVLRKNYELQRFDYVTLLNEVLLERRMELIEMVCASFLGFITYFHEGNYVADTIKKEVDQCNRHINIKRPMYLKSGEGIKEQRVVVEKALELPMAVVNAAAAAAAAAASASQSPSGALSPTGGAPSSAALEKALQWKVHDAFPTASTASGMLSPAAQAQQEVGLVVVTVPSATPGGAPCTVPSPYAHASIRGNLVPIEKEGYLRKQSSSLKKDWKKRWFILQNGQLFYVRDSDNLQPTFVQNVLLCTVRLSQKSELDLCFDLISPNKRVYTLQAETEAQRAEWMAVFQNCSESLLNSSGSMLTAAEQGMSSSQLREHNENKASATQSLRTLNPVCVDCGAKDPDWACINLGIMICIECSGIHRSMGVHISKVRSISLDSWTTELLDLMRAIGNAKFNALYEGALYGGGGGGDGSDADGNGGGNGGGDGSGSPDAAAALHTPKPTPSSSRDEREAFITLKYQRKAFLSKAVLEQASHDPREHVADLLARARNNDVIGIMNCLSLGVKVDDTLAAPSDSSATAAASVTEQQQQQASAASAADASATCASPMSDGGSPDPSPSPVSSLNASGGSFPSASPTSFSGSSGGPSGADVLGTRALHVAAQHDHMLALELLLQNNAKETLLNEQRQTALQVAQAHNSMRAQARLTKTPLKKA